MSVALKFLVTNPIAGLAIGSKGAAISEMAEVTDAKVVVSAITEVYPGTSERVVLISGPVTSVDMAQSLFFDMLALNVEAKGDKSVAWSPRAAAENPGNFNDVQVTGKITIPQSIAGLCLGKGGANMKAMTTGSRCKTVMSTQNEAIFTKERTIELSGTTEACSKFCSMLLAKMAEDPANASYQNKTSYASPLGGTTASIVPGRPLPRVAMKDGAPEVDMSNQTTITLELPDQAAGVVIGRLGANIREISSFSGATITVAPRPAGAGTDGMRTVTITGTPLQTSSAQLFIQQKLEQPQPAQPTNTRRPARK